MGMFVIINSMSLYLKNLTSGQIYSALSHLGVTANLARRIQSVILRKDSFPDKMDEVSGKLLDLIRAETFLPHLEIIEKEQSPIDGFTRYLFRGSSNDLFEAVRIPIMHNHDKQKYIVCVSSQIGCAVGCSFCYTGKLGFVRNLETWEIVDQVVKIQADSEFPVRGVVFMGMGEPMLNYDAVINAAHIMSEPSGLAISGKAITISTSGIIPGIKRFTGDNLPFRLIVSLSSADHAMRKKLIPIEEQYPLTDLIDSLREYHRVSGQRISLAWTMISGVNTSEDDARMIAELTKGIPVKLDLIDVNDPSKEYSPPSEDELNRFRDFLRIHLKMPVSRRYSGGKEVNAACGLLAGRKKI
jgi:23S rRNA (adenine2503-C2)-methyltransferase